MSKIKRTYPLRLIRTNYTYKVEQIADLFGIDVATVRRWIRDEGLQRMMPSMIGNIIGLFVAFSMCMLAVQKLRDLDAFSMQFITYDILAMRWVRYSYIYPYAEAFAGIGMLAGAILAPITAPVALIIGSMGAVSVIKAVYIDKRELKCACVGGDSNVPLGAISLAENVMMMGMAIWMLAIFL